MNREEKYLVIDDISGRIPHGVVFNTDWGNKTLKGIQYDNVNTLLYFGVCNFTNKVIETYVSEVKPYLFPISSMSDKQKKELDDTLIRLNLKALSDEISSEVIATYEIDFYNKNHIDYRGLIPKGLALDATGLNIYF
jgi:hypothetical protein